MHDRPTDPMVSRVGMAAGCEAEMHACSRAAEEIKRRRTGIRDHESRELSRQIGELFHRQAGIYHLLSVALLPPQKRERPLGLWGHLRAWWRERRG
jgi:hypothetical protein